MNDQIENTPQTTGEVRRLMLETIISIRDGGLDASQASGMAAIFKELNNNMKEEVNRARLKMQADQISGNFTGPCPTWPTDYG